MMKVYVCSPYRAKDGAELDRNIEYAQALTRRALKEGLAPITPHLYITQCLDEKKPQERAQGLAEEYAKRYACCFCRGRNLHTCNGYSCKEPYQRAYDYAMSKVAAGCMVVKIE